ncbi:MAG: UDP-glucose--hexose-1-phosphate uridylyltransferase [Oscillospiraceae bacterium]
MDVDTAIGQLLTYALQKELIAPGERAWAANAILGTLGLSAWREPSGESTGDIDLPAVLDVLLDDAYARGLLPENSVTFRDLLDTRLLGSLTPRPAQVVEKFWMLYEKSPEAATDWYYRFAQDTNYIRRDRIARDQKWVTPTPYGDLDITINLAKPEKDPKAIAAARTLPVGAYPHCQLCAENEGYPGTVSHPARGNLRLIPVTVNGGPWYLQYSPYVYYNEHCIVLNGLHTPMAVNRACFEKLLDFVRQFPHYFVGSNADLPIVGGSILAHDHFQGGHYVFPMERAPVETPVFFDGFSDVTAGILRWPMSVLRLTCGDTRRLIDLADCILTTWRGYSDPSALIFAETEGQPHNTITPIARKRDGKFELDLVLRNNLTTPEHPMGLYHPHAELHHIKKENIGLIEVMGLAVLPARLRNELSAVADCLVTGGDLRGNPLTEKHADWAEGFRNRYAFTAENAPDIVRQEVGQVFATVLEQAGVYRRDETGKTAFLRFTKQVKA